MRIAVVALLLSLSTSIAAAQAPGETMSWEPDPTPPSATAPAPQATTVSYRSDILLADGVSLGLVLLGPVARSGEVAGLGVSGYFLGAPIVHLAHGRGTAALASFGMRAGLPLLGAMIGFRAGPNDIGCVEAQSSTTEHPTHGWGDGGGCGGGSIAGMLLGGIAGGVTAIVIDTRYLATYEKRVAPPTWSASITPRQGGATFGVAGSF